MDDIANYCFQIYRLQGMSDLRASSGNVYTMLIFRGVELPSHTFLMTRV